MQERMPQYFQPLRNCRGLLWWKGFREKWRYSWWGAGRVIVADFLQPLAISEGQIQNGRVPLSLSIPPQYFNVNQIFTPFLKKRKKFVANRQKQKTAICNKKSQIFGASSSDFNDH